jgi:tetratricopeptide (TPR) repeat protein
MSTATFDEQLNLNRKMVRCVQLTACLYRTKNTQKALEQFEHAEKLSPDDINLAYNIGLIYFDLKKYDKAMAYAEKAYQGKCPLQGLKQKLIKVGKWVEPKPLPEEKEPKPEQPKAPDPESTEPKQ